MTKKRDIVPVFMEPASYYKENIHRFKMKF